MRTATSNKQHATWFRDQTTILVAFLLATAAWFSSTPSAFAADPVIRNIEVQSPSNLTVGDRVRYVITLEADRGTNVALSGGGLPPYLSQTGRLETESRDVGNGRVLLTVTLEAAPFFVGELPVPPIVLRYTGPDGASGELSTRATSLIVRSVLPASGGTLTPRDLKPQAEIGSPQSMTVYYALAGVLVALLIVLLLLAWRLTHKPRPRAIVLPVLEPAPLSVEDRARLQIDAAALSLADGDFLSFYTTVSSAIRTYLTERFEFPAFALTTTELQSRMVAMGMDRWQARLVAGLLNQCDAAVFASYRPAPDRADADLTAAYEIIEMSRPAPMPEPEPVGAR